MIMCIIVIIMGGVLLLMGYLYFLGKILKPYQLRRVFLWTYIYKERYGELLTTLLILELLLTPINMPLLLMSGWKWRL